MDEPELEITTSTSCGLNTAAAISWMCVSEYATVEMPKRKNLCCASWATMPELPTP